MPQFVSDLEDAVGTYVHPDLTFLGVLNEVLPQLASKGIWKDLTFEKTLPALARTDRFFTLPEDSDALLYALVDNSPVPPRPLWNAFANVGAVNGRVGCAFGAEDAGYAPVKEVLDGRYNYALFILPDFRWGEIADLDSLRTVGSFLGSETVKITYENWEGITKTVTKTLAAVSTPQALPARGVRNIISISYTGFTSVTGRIVALPISHYGDFTRHGGTIASVSENPSLPTAFTTLVPSLPTDVYAFSMGDTGTFDYEELTVDAGVTDDAMTLSTYTGPSVSFLPVAFFSADVFDDIVLKQNEAENAKTLAICSGTGISRYRLFRHQALGNSLHVLLRRKIPKYTADTEIVYLDNISALKYAILANTAEYNNDPTQAKTWWNEAKRELDEELAKTLGANTPQVRFDPSGGFGAVESMQ